MARRKRAENHADHAGPDANQAAIETLVKAAAKANKGHNSGEVPEETIANHINLIRAAEVEWREKRDEASTAQGVLRQRYKVAKHDGVDVDSLKLAFRIAERATGDVVSEQRNVGRYLRIMGAPIGTQWTLFEEAEDGPTMEPELAGQHAWRNSEPRTNNPFTPGSVDFVNWDAGFSNAEAAHARKMAPAGTVGA